MAKELNEPCKMVLEDGRECGLKHNRLIHGSSILGVNAVQVHNVKVLVGDDLDTANGNYNYNCDAQCSIFSFRL